MQKNLNTSHRTTMPTRTRRNSTTDQGPTFQTGSQSTRNRLQMQTSTNTRNCLTKPSRKAFKKPQLHTRPLVLVPIPCFLRSSPLEWLQSGLLKSGICQFYLNQLISHEIYIIISLKSGTGNIKPGIDNLKPQYTNFTTDLPKLQHNFKLFTMKNTFK